MAGIGGTSGLDPKDVRAADPLRAAASYKPGGRVAGIPRRAPDLYEVRRCMAMVNSVASKAPRCLVSDKNQIRPRTSFGRRARSKICFAVSPRDQTVNVLDAVAVSRQ